MAEKKVILQVGGVLGTSIYFAIGVLCFALFSNSGAFEFANMWAIIWVVLWPIFVAWYFIIWIVIVVAVVFVIWFVCYLIDEYIKRKAFKRDAKKRNNRLNRS